MNLIQPSNIIDRNMFLKNKQVYLMSKLTSNFDVSYNSLTGHIPKIALQYLTDMKDTFKLDHNQFSGTIPSEIGLLTKMTVNVRVKYDTPRVYVLQLCKAEQRGTFCTYTHVSVHARSMHTPSPSYIIERMCPLLKPWTCLPALNNGVCMCATVAHVQDKLELDNNYLCGTIPEEVSELTDLTGYFSMYGNSLCGEVPTILQSGAASVQHWAYTEGTYVNQTCQEVCEQGGDEELLGIGVGGVVGIVLAILLLLGACFAFAWSQGSLGSAGGSGGSSKEGRRQAAQQFEDAKSPMMNEAAAYEPPKAAPSAPNEF
jgi:hypothetical protein